MTQLRWFVKADGEKVLQMLNPHIQFVTWNNGVPTPLITPDPEWEDVPVVHKEKKPIEFWIRSKSHGIAEVCEYDVAPDKRSGWMRVQVIE